MNNETNNEYLLKVQVKNNLIYSKIMKAGYKSVAEFCRTNNMHPSNLGKLLNFKTSPFHGYKLKQTLSKTAQKLCDIFSCEINDLFTDKQLNLSIKETKSYELSENSLTHLLENKKEKLLLEHNPYEQVINDDMKEMLDKTLDTISEREKKVLEYRFFDDLTLKEVGKILKVSGSRIREIEAKALRKLRHPTRADELKEFIS